MPPLAPLLKETLQEANLFISLVVERMVCFGSACVLTGLHARWIIPGLVCCSLAWEEGWKAMVE